MYVVVNQKSQSITGPFEEYDDALEWIVRAQVGDDFDGYCTTYEVRCLHRANIA